MKEPFLYKGSEPLTWSFSQVVELVQLATSLGCLENLVKEADQAAVAIRVPPETVNFVKTFLFRGGYHKGAEAAHVQTPVQITPSNTNTIRPEMAHSAAAATGARNIIASAACIGPRPPTPGPPVFPPPEPGHGPDDPGPFQ